MHTIHSTERQRVGCDADGDAQLIAPPREFENRYKVNRARIRFFSDEQAGEPFETVDVPLEEKRYGVDVYKFSVDEEKCQNAFYEMEFFFDPALDDPYVRLDTSTVEITREEFLEDLDPADFDHETAAELEQMQQTRGMLHWIYPAEIQNEVDYVRIEVPNPDGGPEEYLLAELFKASEEEKIPISQGLHVPAELAEHQAHVTFLKSPDEG